MKKRVIDRTMFYNATPEIFRKAEELRNKMTEAEKFLWEELKNNKFGVRFKAQHPIENFIVDFYCHTYKLVIEIDGKIHDFQKSYDKGREAEIEKYGIKILRFSNNEVLNNMGSVISSIENFIKKSAPPLGAGQMLILM